MYILEIIYFCNQNKVHHLKKVVDTVNSNLLSEINYYINNKEYSVIDLKLESTTFKQNLCDCNVDYNYFYSTLNN